LPRAPVVATIRLMKTSRRLLVVLAGACMFIVSTVAIAGAQTPVDPSTTPVENTGGWVFSMAQFYDQLTPEALRDAARTYLDTNRYVEVTLLPEGK